ncbi:MAG: glycosyltransferase family 4 protein [Caulobacteraceae bacterium]|nr:glycosyltransferase family 4 protein [Caulobacteraceae bacterium]
MIYIATQCFFPTRGGIEATMTALADHLTALGHKVRVFADGDAADAAGDGAKPYPIQRFSGPKPWRRWRKKMAIAAAMRRETVEGIFADSWKSLDAIPPTDRPIAMLAHGSEFPKTASAAKHARLTAGLERPATIIANSDFTADQVRALLRDRPGRVRIVLPSIEAQPEPTPEAMARARALIDAPGPVITTLARLEPRKGVDRTLQALTGLSERHPGLVYVVAGAGEDEGRLKSLASELGMEAHVRFAGRVDDDLRAALLAATDIFSMPVRREGNSVEGFGLTYIEAAWYGAPALAGREGGAASAVLDGQTGLLCDGDDAALVEAALARLLDDEPLRHRLGAAAAARARDFVWDAHTPEYLAAIGIGG